MTGFFSRDGFQFFGLEDQTSTLFPICKHRHKIRFFFYIRGNNLRNSMEKVDIEVLFNNFIKTIFAIVNNNLISRQDMKIKDAMVTQLQKQKKIQFFLKINVLKRNLFSGKTKRLKLLSKYLEKYLLKSFH